MADRICSYEGCQRPLLTRGYCRRHYERLRYSGELQRVQQPRGTCSMDGCERPHKARGLCSTHYWRWRTGKDVDAPLDQRETYDGCVVDGCERRHHARSYCCMHSNRLRRGTDLHAPPTRASGEGTINVHGRLIMFRPEHPLANAKGCVINARLVLFAKIGYGPHRCHWCTAHVLWRIEDVNLRLEADHVDGDKLNDDPANIVPSCKACNIGRKNRAQARAQRGH